MSVSVHACNPQLHKDKHVVSRNILPLEFISNEKKITIINNNKKSKTKWQCPPIFQNRIRYNNLYNLKLKLQVLITQTIISYQLTAWSMLWETISFIRNRQRYVDDKIRACMLSFKFSHKGHNTWSKKINQ